MKKLTQKDTISRRVVACIASATLTLSMIPVSAIAFASTTELSEADAPAAVQADTTQASGQDVTQPAGEGNTQPAGTVETGAGDAGTSSTDGSGDTENGTEVSQEDTSTFMLMSVEGEEVDENINLMTAADTGTCGTNVTYSYYSETKQLVISGTGPMKDSASSTIGAPWYNKKYRNEIESIVIEEGVTTVGGRCFQQFASLKSVQLPSTIESIGKCAFYQDKNLSKIEFPEGLKSIGGYAFQETAITEVVLPSTFVEIGDRTPFYKSPVTKIVFKGSVKNITSLNSSYKLDLLNNSTAGVEVVVLDQTEADYLKSVNSYRYRSATFIIPVAVESIVLNESALDLQVGASQALVATVSPDNATNKTVTWTSSDETIATVSAEGVVTAVKAGTVTVTATAGDKTATCEVIVKPKEIVAQIGDVTYPTLEAAIEAAQDGDTVLLLKDADAATVNKTVTIDLGGNTINKIDVVGNGADNPGITATIYNGTVETADITNRGKILSNKIEIATVNAANGRLETNGGTYGTVNVTAGGNVHINNGTFATVIADGANYASIKNGTFGTVAINNTKTKSISGGTFDAFDTNLRSAVVAGKIVVKTKDGKFAVMNLSQVVATADGWGYMSLDDAINAVKNGGTVELLKDNMVDTWNQIWDAKDVTINGNGKTLTVGNIESGVNGNFLLYRAQNLVVNDLNIVLNNGGAFDMKGGTLDGVTVAGGRFAVSGASNTTITNCDFAGQSVMAIYTDDSQGAPGLVVDSCTFTNTRVGILRADERITNCMVTGSADWYQLTVVGTNAVISGNVFTGNDKALELYGQPTNITRNNLANAGKIYAGNDIDPLFTEADLSANYWGGSYRTDVAGIAIESYYTDVAMTNLVTIETPGDDNPGNQGEQPSNPGTTNPGTTNEAQGGNAGTTIINRTVTLQPAAAADDEQPAEAIADDATPLASNAQAESEDIEDNDTPMASFDQGQFESDQAGLIDWTVVALSIAGVAVLGGLFFLLARKRKKDEEAA